MKKSKFSDEQIAFGLREVEGGRPVADVGRQLGISEATFYVWKKKFGHLGASEVRRLSQLEDENSRLKRDFADLFFGMAVGDGAQVARVLFETPLARPAGLDLAAFESDIQHVVRRHHGRD